MRPSIDWIGAAFALACTSSRFTAVRAQDPDLGPDHNVTSLLGTWSSGSGAVRTGVGFANPVNFTFTYPNTTGISYAFTVDVLSDGSAGYFEEAMYRFTGNGTQPTCIVGVVQWQHGTYTINANGSITLNPFAADGRQQVQDMCAAHSNVISQFNQTTLYEGWNIVNDPTHGVKLQMYQFNGAPLSPLYLISQTPSMLPTTTLTNTTQGQEQAVGAGLRRLDAQLLGAFGIVGAALVMGVTVLF